MEFELTAVDGKSYDEETESCVVLETIVLEADTLEEAKQEYCKRLNLDIKLFTDSPWDITHKPYSSRYMWENQKP